MITTEQNILNTLGYFDLFQYPLMREDICKFHASQVAASDIDAALDDLLKNKMIFRLDEFYSLNNDRSLAERRRKGNSLAARQLKRAKRVAKLLSRFPYVKGVTVSGSLSKNFATEKTDIDFFIVTAANRLWIARTCMHLYKKFTFITGRQNWFCMNYYVDEQEPEITEQNIFTAMEIVTLLPMQGKSSLDNFIAENSWAKKYFPLVAYSTDAVPEINPGYFRKLFEKIFNGSMGDKLDKWLMHVTDKRWQKKSETHQLNSKGISMGMLVGRHFSKPDPRHFQHKILKQYEAKVQGLLQQHSRIISLVL